VADSGYFFKPPFFCYFLFKCWFIRSVR